MWILVLLAIGTLAYFAIRGRMLRMQEEFMDALRRAHQGRKSSLPSEDMVKCEKCGVYSAPSQQKNCGKPGCPYSKPAIR
jgi:ArsR family metal-binding transcriptional regulator